jgi:hypothetical protein
MSLSDLASLGSFVSVVAAIVFTGQTALAASPAPKPKEDIYVVRSVRLSRTAPTEFCSKMDSRFGKPSNEGDFLLESVRTADGIVLGTDEKTVGKSHLCFGSGSDPKTLSLFVKGNLGPIDFTGRGECLTDRQDFPEPGINSVRCYIRLRDLPDQFVGGLLTSNTILSRQITGKISDPPGYAQASIAIVRLWRRQK